jgi:cytochrome bd-I ubiquinol oxidase subunit X
MWYFAWVLGLAFASTFAILNAIWFEIHHDQEQGKRAPLRKP